MGQLCSRKHSHLGRLTPKNGLRIHQIREMRSFDRYSTVASQIQQLCFIPPLTPNWVPIGRRKIVCYEPQHPSLTPRSENDLEAMKRDAGTAVDISAHTSPTDAHKGHNSGISIRSPINLKNGLGENHQLRSLAPITIDRAFLSDAKQGRKANKCNVKTPRQLS